MCSSGCMWAFHCSSDYSLDWCHELGLEIACCCLQWWFSFHCNTVMLDYTGWSSFLCFRLVWCNWLLLGLHVHSATGKPDSAAEKLLSLSHVLKSVCTSKPSCFEWMHIQGVSLQEDVHCCPTVFSCSSLPSSSLLSSSTSIDVSSMGTHSLEDLLRTTLTLTLHCNRGFFPLLRWYIQSLWHLLCTSGGSLSMSLHSLQL